MSINAQKWAWDQGARLGLRQGELLLLIRIADHADNDGICWPGVAGLARYTVTNESTVRRNLKRLEGRELLHRERRLPKQGRGRVNDAICLHLQAGELHGASETTNRADGARPTVQTEHPLSIGNPQEPSKTPVVPSDDFAEWLEDYRTVTGRPAVGSEAARRAFRARRREFSLAQLKLATRGCHADAWQREHGRDVPETILAGRYCQGYYLAGLKVKPARGLNLIRTVAA